MDRPFGGRYMARKRRSASSALIQAYGLFWRRDEIDWQPGKGNDIWRLYGRRGANRGTLQAADFREQRGIYILYGNYGPHYVGLTIEKGLGRRLKDHVKDKHKHEWDRFSWFGFSRVLKTRKDRLQKLGRMPANRFVGLQIMIRDTEALLIRSMALKNVNKMNFRVAERWEQVKRHEIPKFEKRL